MNNEKTNWGCLNVCLIILMIIGLTSTITFTLVSYWQFVLFALTLWLIFPLFRNKQEYSHPLNKNMNFIGYILGNQNTLSKYDKWKIENQVRKYTDKNTSGKEIEFLLKKMYKKQPELTYALTIVKDRIKIAWDCPVETNAEQILEFEKKNDSQKSITNSHKSEIQHTPEVIKKKLKTIEPYDFEHLVASLFQKMGFATEVTQAGGDKGVDVIATAKVGISEIINTIQVKRQQGNVGRPVLDQLRGSMQYFDATEGTIVTTGDFTKGCYEAAKHPGLLPIRLINGNQLSDLIIKYELYSDLGNQEN